MAAKHWKRASLIVLLGALGCGDALQHEVRFPSTLVVTQDVGRWCAEGQIISGFDTYAFRERNSGAALVVPKATTVLSVRPDSSCQIRLER